MDFQEIVQLIQINGMVLNQINTNLGETNDTILGLINVMGVSEFNQAFQMNEQGTFRMQPDYNGKWINVVRVNEGRVIALQQQRDMQIQQLLKLQNDLTKILQQKSVYERQGREYATLNGGNEDTNYTTLNRQNSAPQQGQVPFGTMGQQPVSYTPPTAYQEENTQGKVR